MSGAVKPRDRAAILLVIAALLVGAAGVFLTTHALLSETHHASAPAR